jgi:DNA polymerase III epsilon subunit-like protein
MRILVFDTETTGLPQSRIISPDTLHLWPHIVQFSFIVYDDVKNSILNTENYIIRMADDFIIPEESITFHGITNEISREKGVKLEYVLNNFFYHLLKADKVVGHNIEFDINIVRIELLRIIHVNSSNISYDILRSYKLNLHSLTNLKNTYCTLQESIDLCNIKALNKSGKEYVKYPKLEELHHFLFNTKPNNLHNSLNDILVTLRCFIKMHKNKDLLELCDDYIVMSNNIGLH